MKEPLEGEIMSTKDSQPRIEDQTTVPNKQRSNSTPEYNTPPYSPLPVKRAQHNDGYVALDYKDTTRHSFFTLTGHRKATLMRELAFRELTSRELGEKYGVTSVAIRSFAYRHRREINLIKNDVDEQIQLIWLSQKINRLAELAHDVDVINEQLERNPDPAYYRIKHAAMRNAAEEMGHLPPRTQVQVTQQVAYLVGGIDAEDV